MNLKKVFVGASILGLFGLSNKILSQGIKENNSNCFGAEFGRIINKETSGFQFGIYYLNPKIQIGYVVENQKKASPTYAGKGIDLLKCGIEFNYFPTNMKILMPYIGSELKYEHESCFVGKENEYYQKNGLGLELKCGVEIKPLKYRKIRPFFEMGYNFSAEKKSKGYPQNPEVVRDRFITVAGIKF